MGLRMTWAVLGAIEKDPDPQNAGQGDAATPTTFPTRVQVGAFAVNFPGEPKVDEAETPLPAGGTTTAHRFEFIRGDSGFHAMWILRPLETNEEPFEAARASVNGIKDMFNVIPGFVSVATEKQGERSFGDRVGWSATYVIRLAGKTPTEMKERIDCVSVDPKMHCFMTTDGPSRRFGDAVTSEFFNHIVVSQ